ncbi:MULTISPECIES: hypothetical protein [Neobacillus]|jgi:hypothetical protein|uniref:Uncharacterized protein n=1 Tax=Neobacillus sedimentimangrovi TaxID=2699460 RepID=A0ABS8QGF7_9BACI|nr:MULTISPECIES: hypothetical protein [Neobacillus]MCD4838344.1 hypothetical protein [Neobacillus sedimentimangrovi]MED3623204.1 hypothetical protein [Neobacillus thermocopriae]MED3715282.1 hypothetical protein [Neobacillus thermocopriae]
MKKISKLLASAAVAVSIFSYSIGTADAASQAKTLTLPSSYGTLTSNAWRSGLTSSGNTYQFEYQTSAVYSGSKTVEWIKTSWETCASLRNSASMSIGVSGDGVSASASSSWQNICASAYWQNSNGSKGAYSNRRNAVIKPKSDYRSGTVSIQNEAKVKLKGDARSWAINASV